LDNSQEFRSEELPGQELCLACGLCCNGAIFADVRLLVEDNVKDLADLGLNLKSRGSARRPLLVQPCAAHDGCRCNIYEKRPGYCRQFDCALLKSYWQGHVRKDKALRIIRSARKQITTVKQLLRDLGDTDESLSIRTRFRQTAKRLERNPNESDSNVFSRLTIAFHEFNRFIAENFYPGSQTR
jgi:Fe-S-cluster containining protein